MSQRTKIFIAALFLVLLGIPMLHIVFHWHPQNPLRFRVVGQHLETDAFTDETIKDLEIEVLNTSSTPLVADRVILWGTPPSGTREEVMGFLYPLARRNGADFIQPHTSIRCPVFLSDPSGVWRPSRPKVPIRDMRIEYTWASRLKFQTIETCRRLSEHLPLYLNRHIPTPTPGVDSAPLEVVP
jgi:hypothetical protein